MYRWISHDRVFVHLWKQKSKSTIENASQAHAELVDSIYEKTGCSVAVTTARTTMMAKMRKCAERIGLPFPYELAECTLVSVDQGMRRRPHVGWAAHFSLFPF